MPSDALIRSHQENRKYTPDGNPIKLRDVTFFTFEPHVRQVGGRWGFKHENIFFFNEDDRVEEL